MTRLLEKAVEAVSRLTPEAQDEIARAMLRLAAEDDQPEEIPAEHLDAVLEGLGELLRGELAPDDEVEALFRSFRQMRLRFTARAFRDLNDISAFIRERDPRAAARVTTAILESLNILTHFPMLGDHNL